MLRDGRIVCEDHAAALLAPAWLETLKREGKL
jgi:hypothetical protein